LWSQNDIITSWLRLTAISNYLLHTYETYKVFQHILSMLSIGIGYQPYTYTGKPILHGSHFGVLGHLWSQNDVITSCLRLTATSKYLLHTYETYKVFQHILSMLSIGIGYQPYTYTGKPILHGSHFGVLGHLWSQNDVITSCLRLTATSNYLLHPYEPYTKCLSKLICCT
jgi:hypothetical protein